jgi:hypothetical protein
MRVRPSSSVPKPVWLLLAVGLCAQLTWHLTHPPETPNAALLPPSPSLTTMRLVSLGEPLTVSRLLLLYVQSFDDQPGVTAAFWNLDYARVQHWLDLSLQLDPRGQYPLYLASHVYGETSDTIKKRMMYNYVYNAFFDDPNQRWEPLANAAIMTRHKLHDLPKAEQYARAIREKATGPTVPDWAKQMDIFMLADLQQYDKALGLLDALISSGQIGDAGELQFLKDRRTAIAVLAGSGR